MTDVNRDVTDIIRVLFLVYCSCKSFIPLGNVQYVFFLRVVIFIPALFHISVPLLRVCGIKLLASRKASKGFCLISCFQTSLSTTFHIFCLQQTHLSNYVTYTIISSQLASVAS
jgi:hypothetical protein